jgi:hypothetical protein
LELGRHLVRELDLEDGVDTLGRWMAHHVAALIHAAEHAETPQERSMARAQATETIIRIWSHRSSLPGKAYPLARYKEILKILDRLRLDNGPFRFVAHAAESELDRLSERISDGLAKLAITLNALDPTEKRMFNLLQEWDNPIVANVDRNEASSTDEENGKTRPDVLRDIAMRLVDNMTANLSELRGRLEAGVDTNTNTGLKAPVNAQGEGEAQT